MNDAEWRALADRNRQRVTYPSWKPPEHWSARDKRDPWVPKAKTTHWGKADPRKAEVFERITGWQSKPEPADPPGGTKVEPRPSEWDREPRGGYRRNW